VPNRSVYQTQASSIPPAALQSWNVDSPYGLPPVPVMPETLLLLDLEAHEPCLDLRRVSQLVLDDLGATVQILQLAERECGDCFGRPNRIEHCISDLGVSSCLEAVSYRMIASDRRHGAVAEMWAHSREIAQNARLIADETPDINPDEAYMVGLLHTIGLLPAVLGWDGREMQASDGALEGYKMAKRLALPGFVLDFFAEMHHGGSDSKWPDIMQQAHRRAARSSVPCPFGHEIKPVLC
jgi:hypothetical protein